MYSGTGYQPLHSSEPGTDQPPRRPRGVIWTGKRRADCRTGQSTSRGLERLSLEFLSNLRGKHQKARIADDRSGAGDFRRKGLRANWWLSIDASSRRPQDSERGNRLEREGQSQFSPLATSPACRDQIFPRPRLRTARRGHLAASNETLPSPKRSRLTCSTIRQA
jgi:hypothetical protein